jgi:hypothetical protein
MSCHIKRDGRFLCLNSYPADMKGMMVRHFKRRDNNHISFAEATKRELGRGYCGECQIAFYNILNRMKTPIIIK